ncbi:hypothetical protein TNIN_318111 [Trichonephila inaurata madagascariensis]|uniref:Uncharacterized protein n=1 Tax=Trichonephila inaurata madagascariensis TaxID=2747483 RepID=A0A8X6YSU5_9ARAC|nr:hypothetical protein TNIN_318111 [Trichonephila inaurata madagascariensis]
MQNIFDEMNREFRQLIVHHLTELQSMVWIVLKKAMQQSAAGASDIVMMSSGYLAPKTLITGASLDCL